MADIEYIAGSKYFFDIDQIPGLIVQSISGISIEITVAAGSNAIGCTEGGVTQTQATPGQVKFSSAVTIKYPAGNEAAQQKITDWYNLCHAKAFSGGAKQARSNRRSGSIFVYDGDGNVACEYVFTDLFPSKLTQSDQLGVDKSGELALDTMELLFTGLKREI